jgi:hypothetical protein
VDERRLSIRLSDAGRARVAADSVLDPDRLGRALRALPAADRAALLRALAHLADAAEQLDADQISRPGHPRNNPAHEGPGGLTSTIRGARHHRRAERDTRSR